MIKLKGNSDSDAPSMMEKALGYNQKPQGNAKARELGMPSAMKRPEKPKPEIKHPMIRGKTAQKRDDDDPTVEHKDAGHELKGYDDEDIESDSDFASDNEDDAVVLALRKARLTAMQKRFERRKEFLGMGHGEYSEIAEDEFLKTVTKSKYAVVHFHHRNFERCKIVDKHMPILAKKYVATRFVTLNAEKAPFFVAKLKVKMLPTIIMFKDGIAVDRIVGFDDLGAVDTFKTQVLEKRIQKAGVIAELKDDEDEQPQQSSIRKSTLNQTVADDSDDEL